MTVHVFQYDESGYLEWIMKNPDGYVVNTRRVLDPKYLVLHRASCWSIHTHRNQESDPGGFTERSYQKICSLNVSELEEYLIRVTRAQKAFTKVCSLCSGDQK